LEKSRNENESLQHSLDNLLKVINDQDTTIKELKQSETELRES